MPCLYFPNVSFCGPSGGVFALLGATLMTHKKITDEKFVVNIIFQALIFIFDSNENADEISRCGHLLGFMIGILIYSLANFMPLVSKFMEKENNEDMFINICGFSISYLVFLLTSTSFMKNYFHQMSNESFFS